jgi:urease accessory protein
VWQLVDSSFPTGGFAHSNGLEAAWHHGVVQDGAQLLAFAQASLQQTGHSQLPFVNVTHTSPERLDEVDRFCDAATPNHVANRASRLQGRAFLAAATRIFFASQAPTLACPRPVCGHFAPVFGTVLRALGLPRERTLRVFLFNHLRALTTAAVRLNIVGPLEAQTLQHQLTTAAEEVFHTCSALDLEDVAQTAPLLDLWQGAHDRLHSRLFQS